MTEEKITLENCCDTGERLKKYLRLKGETHNYYKCYSKIDRIVDIRETKCLYLGDGGNWNDITDRKSFNSQSDSIVHYGKCFSFSREESVAMWMLYGGIDKLGGMIDFTKKGMHSVLNVSSVVLGHSDGNYSFHPKKTLERKDFDIYITDVIYYKKHSHGYYINRSDEKYLNLSEEVFKELRVCKKAYPWKYENECRLIVAVSKSLIDDECNTVRINLETLDLGKSMSRIYRAPNYSSEDIKGSLPSNLDGTVNWSL